MATGLTEADSERFWAKVDIDPDGCWIWTAAKCSSGYGNFRVHRLLRNWGAHRLAYELLVGTVPEGMQLDHHCRNRACVNPDHLEPVTQQENISRGVAGINMASKTHCPHGHEYTPENTIRKNGSRHCRQCRLDYFKRRRQERKLAKAA